MAELSEQQKHSIVTQLAIFARPAEVVAHMLEEWGIEIDRFQVRAYDPTNARFEGGERWRLLFETTRSAYLDDVAKVPIAHRAYRLNELQRRLFKHSPNQVMLRSPLRSWNKQPRRFIGFTDQRAGAPCTGIAESCGPQP